MMEKNDMTLAIAIIALILAAVVGLMMMTQPAAPQGAIPTSGVSTISWLKEPLSNSDKAFSGDYLSGQLMNDSYVGQVVYIGTTDTYWHPADPTTTTKVRNLGVIAQKASANGTADAVVMMNGVVYNGSWSFTKGAALYANRTTPGTVSTVREISNTTGMQAVGWAFNTSVMYFAPAYNMTSTAY
jgi:hypothetical protein